MRYASRYTFRLCRSTKTRNASRAPASVRSTAMASLSMVVSTLGLIRFIRQDFGVAVRSNSCDAPQGLPRADRLKRGREGPQGQKAALSYRVLCGSCLRSRREWKYRIITKVLRVAGPIAGYLH